MHSSDKKDVISCDLSRNAISTWLLATQENRVVGDSELGKNILIEGIDSSNGNMLNINFLHWQIIKYNW